MTRRCSTSSPAPTSPAASFPRPKNLADFDFSANRAIDAASINTLAGCGWVNKGQSLYLRPKPRRSG